MSTNVYVTRCLVKSIITGKIALSFIMSDFTDISGSIFLRKWLTLYYNTRNYISEDNSIKYYSLPVNSVLGKTQLRKVDYFLLQKFLLYIYNENIAIMWVAFFEVD